MADNDMTYEWHSVTHTTMIWHSVPACLSACLSAWPVYLSNYICCCLPVCESVLLICLPVCISLYPIVCLPTCLSVRLSVCLSLYMFWFMPLSAPGFVKYCEFHTGPKCADENLDSVATSEPNGGVAFAVASGSLDSTCAGSLKIESIQDEYRYLWPDLNSALDTTIGAKVSVSPQWPQQYHIVWSSRSEFRGKKSHFIKFFTCFGQVVSIKNIVAVFSSTVVFPQSERVKAVGK